MALAWTVGIGNAEALMSDPASDSGTASTVDDSFTEVGNGKMADGQWLKQHKVKMKMTADTTGGTETATGVSGFVHTCLDGKRCMQKKMTKGKTATPGLVGLDMHRTVKRTTIATTGPPAIITAGHKATQVTGIISGKRTYTDRAIPPPQLTDNTSGAVEDASKLDNRRGISKTKFANIECPTKVGNYREIPGATEIAKGKSTQPASVDVGIPWLDIGTDTGNSKVTDRAKRATVKVAMLDNWGIQKIPIIPTTWTATTTEKWTLFGQKGAVPGATKKLQDRSKLTSDGHFVQFGIAQQHPNEITGITNL